VSCNLVHEGCAGYNLLDVVDELRVIEEGLDVTMEEECLGSHDSIEHLINILFFKYY
jgi:hypothetical protein